MKPLSVKVLLSMKIPPPKTAMLCPKLLLSSTVTLLQRACSPPPAIAELDSKVLLPGRLAVAAYVKIAPPS